MITLRPTSLHWLNEALDDPADLCAHSGVEFVIDGDVLIQQNDGNWTVSAAALYLLRTLSQPHRRNLQEQKLFPCCGHGLFEIEGHDVLILGCPNGIDFDVVQTKGEVVVTTVDGREHWLAAPDWRQAVCAFSDAVRAFYVASSPKRPADDVDKQGYAKFMSEWTRRRSIAEND
jgi:hypothetical protein